MNKTLRWLNQKQQKDDLPRTTFMYYVYILKSKKNSQLYTGSTDNLKRRFLEHNSGKEASTKRYVPWELFYYEAYKNETLARLREQKLKYHGNALREVKRRIGILDRREKSGAKGLPSTILEEKKNGAGFTILELMITVFIITVGLIGVSGLINQTLFYASLNSSKLAASYLAQEGIEIVRNIVDTNMVEIYGGQSIPWDDGLNPGYREADYDDSNLSVYSDQYLKINGGFYNYNSGTETKFKRKITINSAGAGADILNIIVEVSWQEKGKDYKITVQEDLYNWRQ